MVGPSVMAPFGGQDEIGIDWVGGDFSCCVVGGRGRYVCIYL